MRINLHKSQQYLYIFIEERDALRKIGLFEDMDETFVNFNLDSKKKSITLTRKEDFLEISKFSYPLDKLNKNFFFSYFNEKI